MPGKNPDVSTSQDSDDTKTEPDVVSDPAEDDRTGHDWTAEGGATKTGPASDSDSP